MVIRLLKTALDTFCQNDAILKVRNTIKKIYNIFASSFSRLIRYTIRRLKYGDSAPKATQLVYIDPGSIEYVVWPGFYSKLSREHTHICGGVWDNSIIQKETGHWDNLDRRSLIPLEKYTPYTSFVRHFRDGVPWKETDYFKQALADPNRNRLGTINSPRWEKFEEWDNLYQNMKKEGYVHKNTQPIPFFTIPRDEILVDIGRNGNIFLDDGRHRLMIAKILGVDQIPVRVLVRHRRWQNKREAFLSNNNTINHSCKLSDHPDIKPINN